MATIREPLPPKEGVKEIDKRLHLLKVHLPYHESDHVLNLAYNVLCGGTRLEDIERLAVDRVSSEEIARVAVEQGMLTLHDDGIEKALEGITSLEEVLRVVV